MLAQCVDFHGERGDGRCALCGVDLGDRRRRYCSDAHRRLWRANHVWPEARALALRLAGYRCEECGEIEDVEVHHLVPTTTYGHSCAHHQTNLRPLCTTHHVAAHARLRGSEKPVQLRLAIAA